MKILSQLVIWIFVAMTTATYAQDVKKIDSKITGKNMPKNIIQLAKGKDLVLKYHLEDLLKRDADEKGLLENYILFSDGDFFIEGDLFLDYKDWAVNQITTNIAMPDHYTEDIKIVGMVIRGDLTVNGAVINSNGDGGPTLLVQGDLYARNLIAGGSYIFVDGNTIIDEMIYAHYNHGSLIGTGNVSAKVLINDDHGTGFSGAKNIAHIYDDGYIEDEYRIVASLQSLLHKDIVYYEEILEYLLEGRSVLNDSPYVEPLPEVLDQHFFDEKLARLMESKYVAPSRILQRIPRAYRSETLAKKALAFNVSNIEFMPKEWMTESYIDQIIQQSNNHPTLMEFIPERYKTRAFCMKAAQRGSLSIADVPKSLLKDKALLLEIIRHNAWDYRNLPEKLVVQEDFIMLALEGHEYDNVLDVLAVLEERNPQQNIYNHMIKKALDRIGLDLLEKLPGKAVTTEVFNYAQDKFRAHDRWATLVKAHSMDFWQMYNGQLVHEILNDINHEARYDGALEIVWSHFWTDEFLSDLLKYTKPYAALDEIPYAYWTPAFIEVAQQHDRYGYYTDYIEDYRRWQKRKSRPVFFNKVMELFER